MTSATAMPADEAFTAQSAAPPLRVCLGSPYAYPLFDASDARPVGGAETHAWLLAKGLSAIPGVCVDVVVRAPRRFRRRQFGRITVWNIGDGLDEYRQSLLTWRSRGKSRRPFPWILLWGLPRLALAKLLRRGRPVADGTDVYRAIAADCYACFGVSRAALTVCRSAHGIGRPVVLFLESNGDLDACYRPDSDAVSPTGELAVDCAALIAEADVIIAQSPEQQRMLVDRFGRDAVILTNPFDLDEWNRAATATITGVRDTRYLLWIGRADVHHKRPQLCLELARRLPEVRILMVLNPYDPAIEERIRAAAPPNVTIVDRFPYQEMPAIFAGARGYLSTGSRDFEGAPHVFLQAAASGVPIASLEVDGDILRHTEAGRNVHGDFDQLVEVARRIWTDDDVARRWADNGREYMRQHYSLSEVSRTVHRLLPARITSSPSTVHLGRPGTES